MLSQGQHRAWTVPLHPAMRLERPQFFFWYGGLLLALYNYNGLVAPRLSLYNFWFVFVLWMCPCNSSALRAPGKKGAVPIYKVLVRPSRESNSRPTSTEADALTTVATSPVSSGVALIVWFTTNGMCAKNKNMCMWREQAIIEWSWWVTSLNACEPGERLIVLTNSDDESDLYCCSLPRCKALRTCRSRFPIATPLDHGLVRRGHKYCFWVRGWKGHKHGRNFVVKCGGTPWCETNIVIGSMQKWRFIYTDSQSYF